ncbi:hypothetical protein BaRGS_00038253 [Batillaria attramentaria]|uniref:HTH psq-type domain-containing protein n=1 Tax=Batillaria attramentaria TaxID=370345 RepID=A0ABD0J7E7_9CAEN
MSKKPKTRTLTLKQKIDIINEVESNPTKKKTTIAEEHKIPKRTLSGIMRDREKYKRLFFSGKVSGQQRRHRKCQTTPEMPDDTGNARMKALTRPLVFSCSRIHFIKHYIYYDLLEILLTKA